MASERPPGRFVAEGICLFLFLLISVLVAEGAHFLINVLLAPLLYIAFTRSSRTLVVTCFTFAGLVAVTLFRWAFTYNSDIFLYAYISIALFLLVFSMLVLAGRSKLHPRIYLLLPPVAWYAIQSVLYRTPIGSYWVELSVFQTTLGPLLSVVGGVGVTFLVVAFNTSVSLALVNRKLIDLLPAAVLCIVYATSMGGPDSKQTTGKDITVALVQGNFSEPWAWRQRHAYHPVFDRYRELTLVAAAQRPDVIVWPEYALPIDITAFNPALLDRTKQLSGQIEGSMVIGSLIHDNASGDHNDSVLIFRRGELVDIYSSTRPILFNEGTRPAREEAKVYGGEVPFGLVVCFEETQPDLFRKYIDLGAGYFVSVTNTQDFGKGTDIASLFGSLRAAETGRYLVRASNTGITAIIAPNGAVAAQLDPSRKGVLVGMVHPRYDRTIYAQFGDWVISALCAGLLLLSVLTWRNRELRTL